MGFFYYRNRILLNPSSPITKLLIVERHDTLSEEHAGYEKTLHMLKRIVTWRGIKDSVRENVRECETFQRAKYECIHLAALLQPFPIPNQVWEEISMDFIEGLPRSMGKSTILVVVDRLSKFAHSFLPLTHLLQNQ